MSGWVKIYRKIQNNPLWTSEKFTRGQAWVDMILLANHDYTFFYKRGVKVDIERGQLARSEVELADRWKWSRNKVRKFLKDLENEQQIEQQKTNVTQIVTIINYDEYQEKEQQTEHQKDSKKTPKGQQKDTYKNVKNNKNVKNTYYTGEGSPIFEIDTKNILLETEEEKEKKVAPKKRKVFEPPNLEEVENYMIEKFPDFQEWKKEASKFWNYYDCKNWMVGKNKMARWKSACTNWIDRSQDYKNDKESNNKKSKRASGNGSGGRTTFAERLQADPNYKGSTTLDF